nr:unnamed protein product [Digitaria exilis]
MAGYSQRLEKLGFPLGQELATDFILASLPPSYGNFISNYHMHGAERGLNELCGMLMTAEADIKKGASGHVLAVQNKPNFKKKDNWKKKGKAKDVISKPIPTPKPGPEPDKPYHTGPSSDSQKVYPDCPLILRGKLALDLVNGRGNVAMLDFFLLATVLHLLLATMLLLTNYLKSRIGSFLRHSFNANVVELAYHIPIPRNLPFLDYIRGGHKPHTHSSFPQPREAAASELQAALGVPQERGCEGQPPPFPESGSGGSLEIVAHHTAHQLHLPLRGARSGQEAKGMSSAASPPHFFISPCPFRMRFARHWRFALLLFLHWRVRMDFAVLSQRKWKGLYHIEMLIRFPPQMRWGISHLCPFIFMKGIEARPGSRRSNNRRGAPQYTIARTFGLPTLLMATFRPPNDL